MAKKDKTALNEAVGRLISSFGGAEQKTTEINESVREPQNRFTEINPIVSGQSADIPLGTVLADKYTIEAPLTTSSGEANLYICRCEGVDYVAKVYRRHSAIKNDIVVALGDMDSPNIAKLYATGEWNGFPYEILPYYKYGSLDGKTFAFEQLRKSIIPALNEGIKALHDRNIIHKDLKPSNIMLCDDEKSVAIIDFGISSIREGGATVVVTNTGMTPEYSAPETFRGLYLEESDYYSLGVTLYQLYTGHTPYSGLDRDTIEKYVAIQSIPFPDKFPPELKRLVIGLTYNDITNRKDKNNPNRRWTYDEVCKWCKGEAVALPGGVDAKNPEESAAATVMPAFRFQYKKYTTVEELAEALGAYWDNGKKRLYRSLLTKHFQAFDQEIASYCIDAEEAAAQDSSKSDNEFFKLLYKMSPRMQSFHWRGNHYPSMQALGLFILDGLRNRPSTTMDTVEEFCANHLFSVREQAIAQGKDSRAGQFQAIESKLLQAGRLSDACGQREQAFLLGYLYSETNDLVLTYGMFDTIGKLTDYVKMVLRDHPDSMDSVSKELITTVSASNGASLPAANPQFAAWLTIQGQKDATII